MSADHFRSHTPPIRSHTPPIRSLTPAIQSLDTLKYRGVYSRQIKDKFGTVTNVRYEPRLKRDKQSLSLGQYDTCDEAKIVHNIAAFFYGNDAFGCLDFEDGSYFAAQSVPVDGRRYFVIPQLTEEKEGEEKSRLVSRKAKEVFKQFRTKQEEDQSLWIESMLMDCIEDEVPREDNVVLNAEGRVNGHSEARPGHNAQAGTSKFGTVMLGNIHPVTSNVSSHANDSFVAIDYAAHATGASEPTPFDATNPSPLSNGHQMLKGFTVKGTPTTLGENSQTTQLTERHNPSYEAGPPTVPANGTLANEYNCNTGNQVKALLVQLVRTSQEKQWFRELVDTLQQEKQELQLEKQELKQGRQKLKREKQELKRKSWELQTQLSELQTQLSELQREVKDHSCNCLEASRPTKKR